MNILFVSSCFPSEEKPYYCIYLEQQAKALAALGNRVDILIPTCDAEPGSCVSREYHGLRVFTLGLKRSVTNAFMTIGGNRRTLAFFPWEDYDVVSIHLVATVTAATVAAYCRGKNVPAVMHYHGLNVWSEYAEQKSLKQKLLAWYYSLWTRRLLKLCRGVVGVSLRTCREVSRKMPGVDTFCVYNGVDGEVFRPPAKPAAPEPFTVICVANLIPIKGQRYLVEALTKLPGDVRLTLVGVGPEEQALRRLAAELGVDHRVEFAGAMAYPKVADRMAQSHMFIMPSCFEAFGCVFAEAMSTGLLTCGCVDTGADEIITHGENGLLLPQKDAEAIAEAVRFAMEKPHAKDIARQGQIRAAELSWDHSAKSLMEVYQKLLKQ